MIPVCRLADPPRGEALRFAGSAAGADSVTIEEEGAVDHRGFLAVHRRADRPADVLGVNRTRPFTRGRRQLAKEAAGRGGSR